MTASPAELYQRYVQHCQRAIPIGYRHDDDVHGLTRLTPMEPDLEGVVMFATLTDAETESAITEQIVYFESIGRDFEWKIHEFDQPADLAVRLEQRGFVSGDREAFMLYPTEGHRPRRSNHAVRIKRITTVAGIRDVVAVQRRVWNESLAWLEASLAAALRHSVIFCAYREQTPIGAGWIDLPENSIFATLHGGSVVPEHRGHGVYTTLFDLRVAEARRRGFQYIAVDAAPMSRPILLKKGFVYICETTPFRWKSTSPRSAAL